MQWNEEHLPIMGVDKTGFSYMLPPLSPTVDFRYLSGVIKGDFTLRPHQKQVLLEAYDLPNKDGEHLLVLAKEDPTLSSTSLYP